MSPEVWHDAIPRIQAVATQLGIPFAMPNEDAGPRPKPPAPWVQIEVAAAGAGPLQIGYDAWEEKGQIFVVLMVPIGGGLLPFLEMRMTFSYAFRGINTVVGLTTPGLTYSDDQSFDPLDLSNKVEGVYLRLPLIVRYLFQTKLVAPSP